VLLECWRDLIGDAPKVLGSGERKRRCVSGTRCLSLLESRNRRRHAVCELLELKPGALTELTGKHRDKPRVLNAQALNAFRSVGDDRRRKRRQLCARLPLPRTARNPEQKLDLCAHRIAGELAGAVRCN